MKINFHSLLYNPGYYTICLPKPKLPPNYYFHDIRIYYRNFIGLDQYRNRNTNIEYKLGYLFV